MIIPILIGIALGLFILGYGIFGIAVLVAAIMVIIGTAMGRN